MRDQLPMLTDTLAPKQAAHLVGVSPDTMGIWRRQGIGPVYYRIVRKILYKREDLLEWMSHHRVETKKPETLEDHFPSKDEGEEIS